VQFIPIPPLALLSHCVLTGPDSTLDTHAVRTLIDFLSSSRSYLYANSYITIMPTMHVVMAHAKENWPPILLRGVDWLCATIVWATVVDKGEMNGACWFARSSKHPGGERSDCNFAVLTGVLTWLWDLAVLALLFLPVWFPSVTVPAFFPGLSLIVSVVLAFFWLGNSLNLAIKYEETCTFVVDTFEKDCGDYPHQVRHTQTLSLSLSHIHT
jgi:hypothetical protein